MGGVYSPPRRPGYEATVHPDDHHLLGMQWEGQLFVDTVLPFGLRSAPKIFNAVADALEWIAHSRGAEHIAHYLDDFVMVGAPATNECRRSLDILMSACRELGVPIATHKCEGPSACLTFLGIEVDTQNLELRLPEEKLDYLKKLLVEWLPRKSCKHRDLESLIGHLSQACKVVRPGRRFLRGMIQLLSVAHKQHHHIRLNQSFRVDLEWWHKFLGSWNGVSMLVQVQSQHPDIKVWSDASGSWGCAAVWNGKWFQISWKDHPEFMDTSIAGKEMLPIAVAAAIWGKEWRGCTVEFNCAMKPWFIRSWRVPVKKRTWRTCCDVYSCSCRQFVVPLRAFSLPSRKALHCPRSFLWQECDQLSP